MLCRLIKNQFVDAGWSYVDGLIYNKTVLFFFSDTVFGKETDVQTKME